MENVLVDQSSPAGLGVSRTAGGGGCRRLAARPPNPRRTNKSSPHAASLARPYLHYSSPSLPLVPHQPPLLPLPPTKHATFPFSPRPPSSNGKTANQPAVAATQRRDKRKKPRAPRMEPATAQKRRPPLERAAPLPPAPAVAEALDDHEQEVARRFVEELLHALAPPPSSLPLPTFSVVTAAKAPLLQAAALDGAADVGRLLRL